MLVSICLPTIRAGSVGTALEAVLRQTSPDWELIVVPQGGDAGLLELLEDFARRDARIRVVPVDWMNANNARNVAIESSRGDVVAFTDDDCEVAENWVEVICGLFSDMPDLGYVGGEVVAPPSDRPWVISTCPSAHVIEAIYRPSEADYRAPHGFYMIGANIAVRRSAVDVIGPFDTALGPGTAFPSCEEQDYGLRAEALDITWMSTNRLVVNHTTGRRYGVRQVLRHHRNYARGRGAWMAKLEMWEHRLADEWSRPVPLAQRARQLLRSPHRVALAVYGDFHARRAKREFAALYELGPDVICRPRLRARPTAAVD